MGREGVAARNCGRTARARCKERIAIAAEYPELETVIAKTENLTAGRRDEVAFGGGALLVVSLRRARVGARRCPVEGLAHRAAIDLETAVFVIVREVKHDFHAAFVAAQRRRCQRQHDPDRVVVNVRAVAAERCFYDSHAPGPLAMKLLSGFRNSASDKAVPAAMPSITIRAAKLEPALMLSNRSQVCGLTAGISFWRMPTLISLAWVLHRPKLLVSKQSGADEASSSDA